MLLLVFFVVSNQRAISLRVGFQKLQSDTTLIKPPHPPLSKNKNWPVCIASVVELLQHTSRVNETWYFSDQRCKQSSTPACDASKAAFAMEIAKTVSSAALNALQCARWMCVSLHQWNDTRNWQETLGHGALTFKIIAIFGGFGALQASTCIEREETAPSAD